MHYKKLAFTLILAILLLILIYARCYTYYARNYSVEWINYQVQSGDTLWHIASIFTPPDIDLREAVYLIRERNDIDPARLEIGRVIEVPIWGK